MVFPGPYKTSSTKFHPKTPLLFPSAAINTAFAIADNFNLSLSQVSICRHPNSYTFWPILEQNRSTGLRYTAFVEIMSPIMSRDMLNQTSPLLDHSYVGWGELFGQERGLGLCVLCVSASAHLCRK